MENVPLPIEIRDGHVELCSVAEFARARGIPAQTLYSAQSSGRIISVRRGKRLYLNLESAERFADAYRKLHPQEGS